MASLPDLVNKSHLICPTNTVRKGGKCLLDFVCSYRFLGLFIFEVILRMEYRYAIMPFGFASRHVRLRGREATSYQSCPCWKVCQWDVLFSVDSNHYSVFQYSPRSAGEFIFCGSPMLSWRIGGWLCWCQLFFCAISKPFIFGTASLHASSTKANLFP